METILRLLLAGRLAAAARERASYYGALAAAALAFSLLAITGIAFLIASAYQALEHRYDGPVAAAAVGFGLLVVALLGAAAATPMIRAKGARARRIKMTADPSIDGLARVVGDVLGDVPPTVVAAAIVGFLVSVFRRR
ncbi:MAG: hypothetical protein AB7O45_00605 [Alphaproteobacteria bacterium]